MIFKFMKKALIPILFTLLLASAWPARSEILMTREAALRLSYGEACQFLPRPVTLTAAEAATLEQKLGSRLLNRFCDWVEVRCGKQTAGYALIDEEMGKHQPITFLVAMDVQGRIKRMEVLVYR